MLGKLLKHEWRSTWKLPTALSVFTIIMTLLGALSFRMPMWQKVLGTNTAAFSIWDLTAVAVLITYFISIIVCVYAIIIYFAIRFYRNLFTDQGYLMHTLPTTPANLIASKTIISGVWYSVSNILMIVSMFGLLYAFMRTLIPADEWVAVSTAFNGLLPDINAVFKEYAGVSVGFSVLVFTLILIVGGFSAMLLAYLCICIGQLFQKHKVAASIIAYFVVSSAISTITSIAILPISFSLVGDLESTFLLEANPIAAVFSPYAIMMPFYYISLALSIVQAVVCFFVCVYITKRKLNLD